MNVDSPSGTPETPPVPDWRRVPLSRRPGFLIRRAHQIHVALFSEECAVEGLTPAQYSMLTALAELGPSEQNAIARAVGLDRANTASVLLRLEQRRFVRRKVSTVDRRQKIVSLGDLGRAVLDRVDAGAARAHARTLDALDTEQAAAFLDALTRIVSSYEADAPSGGQRDRAQDTATPAVTPLPEAGA